MAGGWWGLVGRDAEQRAATAALTEGRSVLLSGTPGVGKTQLAAALAGWETDQPRPPSCLWLQATEAGSATPLAALMPVLRPAGLAPATGSGEPVDLAARAADAVCGWAAEGGLVVCDDVHLLDEASGAVLAEVVRSGVAVVATARTGEGLPDALSQLWHAGGVTRVEVGPLPSGDDEALLIAMLADLGPPEPASARRLLGAAQGNPLVLRELVMHARAVGALTSRGGVIVLDGRLEPGQGLIDVVEQRLRGLEDKSRAALELVALAEPIGVADLEELTSAHAVESLEALGYVRVWSDERRLITGLGHPIYGEVLRVRMPVTTRRRHLDQLARQLERRGTRRRGDLLRLAVWSVDTGRSLPLDVLVAATRSARFAHDYALAERLGRAAMRVGGGTEVGQLLAEAIYLDGRAEEADDLLADLHPGDDDQRALVALQRTDMIFWGRDDAAGAARVLTDAIASTGASRHDELLASLAQIEQLSGRPASALARLEPILGARERGRAFVHAANAAVPALAVSGQCDRALALADEARAVWDGLGDQIAMFDPGVLVIAASLALMEAGRLAEAEDLSRFGHQMAIDTHNDVGRAWMALGLARTALLRGDLSTADSFFGEALVAGSPGFPGLARWALSGRLAVAAQRADLAACRALLAEFGACRSSALEMLEAEVDTAVAWAATVVGDTSEAAERFERAADSSFATGAAGLGVAALHEAFRARGGPLGSSGVTAAVVTLAKDAAAPSDSELMATRAAHLGAARRSDGPALEVVADRFDGIGATLLAAETWRGAAAAHRGAGDPRRANRCEQESLARRARCPGAATPALVGIGATADVALTPREREVVALAAQRLATKEIASRLGLRARTVENHLHRAYAKLGVSGKGDLTRPDPTDPRLG